MSRLHNISQNEAMMITTSISKLSTIWSLRLPHTSRFFVGRQKISTCRLVCGEFRQVCDKIGACRAISDSARSQNVLSGLVGQCAVDQDKLSGLARTSTNEELSWESREQASSQPRSQSPKKPRPKAREKALGTRLASFQTWRRSTRPQE